MPGTTSIGKWCTTHVAGLLLILALAVIVHALPTNTAHTIATANDPTRDRIGSPHLRTLEWRLAQSAAGNARPAVGYPRLLVKMDAWVIARLRPARQAVIHLLEPEREQPVGLDRHELVCWAQRLRIVYGLGFVLLTCLAGAYLLGTPARGLLAGLLLAMSPHSPRTTLIVAATGLAPAHVVFLQFPVCLALCYLLKALWTAPSSHRQRLALALAALLVTEPFLMWAYRGPAPATDTWLAPDSEPVAIPVFRVGHGERAVRYVAFGERPDPVRIGVRSGDKPCTAVLQVGTERALLALAPDEQRILSFPAPPRARVVCASALFPVRLTLRTQMGAVWCSVLANEPQHAWYTLFGGHDWTDLDFADLSVQAESAWLTNAATARSAPDFRLALDSCAQASGTLSSSPIPLPCAPYVLSVDVLVPRPHPARLMFELTDTRGLSLALETAGMYELAPGYHVVRHTFAKTFAPFECTVLATALVGGATLLSWQCVPDATRIRADLDTAERDVRSIAWLHRFPTQLIRQESETGLDVNFANAVLVKHAEWPHRLEHGTRFDAVLRAVPLGRRHIDVNEHVFVFRFVPEGAEPNPCLSVPLRKTFYAKTISLPLELSFSKPLAPGTYEVLLALLNNRTRKKLDLVSPRGAGAAYKRKAWYRLGEITVTRGEETAPHEDG